jgi:hypothetical protein
LHPVTTPVRRWEWIALAGILLAAAILRLGAPGVTEFKRDEANLSQLALDLARGRDLPLLGINSSVGVPNSPVSVYLFALPYLLDDTPILATLFVGALNVIAVALAWMLARRYYGPIAAAAAGLLYAASPWAVIYSRKIWAQDLLPPFVVAAVFTGLLGFGEGKRWARWAHWPLLVITVQIHFGAFTLIPLSLLMLVLWRVSWRDLAIGLGLAALTLLPALAGAYRDDLLTPDTIRNALDENSGHGKTVDTTALDYAWLTVAGTDIHSLAGPEQFRPYLDSLPGVFAVFKLIPLGAVVAAGWLVWRATRRRRLKQSPDVIVIAWLVLPVLAFTWQWAEVAPHYMIPLMPAAYVLCGIGLAGVWQSIPTNFLRGLGVVLLLSVAGLQMIAWVSLLVFLDTHNTPGGFGTPLHYLLDIREEVLTRDPDDVIVVSTEEVAPFDEIPAVWGVLLDPVPHVRFLDGTRTVVIPAEDALELVAWLPDVMYQPPYWESVESATWSENFELRGSTFANAYYSLRPANRVEPDMVAIEPVQFANGARLDGYAIQGGQVLLRWRLDGPALADYQAFVHALDADSNRLTQADRLSWPGRYWQAGDTLLVWFNLAVPPDTVDLYVGMYTTDGVNFQNVAVIDANGAYLGQGATIPLAEGDRIE